MSSPATELVGGGLLTPKQEAFCLAYLETADASEAYRQVYSVGKMSTATIDNEASRLLEHPKVALRLAQLKKVEPRKRPITVFDLIKELEEARQAAMGASNVQSSAAISATMGKAKLLGFLTDRQVISGPDGGPVQYTRVEYVVIDPAEKLAGPSN